MLSDSVLRDRLCYVKTVFERKTYPPTTEIVFSRFTPRATSSTSYDRLQEKVAALSQLRDMVVSFEIASSKIGGGPAEEVTGTDISRCAAFCDLCSTCFTAPLLTALETLRPALQVAAAEVLAAFFLRAPRSALRLKLTSSFTKPLLKLTGSTQEVVRQMGMAALEVILAGQFSSEALREVIMASSSAANRRVRCCGLQSLLFGIGHIGDSSAHWLWTQYLPTVEQLIHRGMRDSDRDVRKAAAGLLWGLAFLNQPRAQAVTSALPPRLLTILEEEQYSALEYLGVAEGNLSLLKFSTLHTISGSLEKDKKRGDFRHQSPKSFIDAHSEPEQTAVKETLDRIQAKEARRAATAAAKSTHGTEQHSPTRFFHQALQSGSMSRVALGSERVVNWGQVAKQLFCQLWHERSGAVKALQTENLWEQCIASGNGKEILRGIIQAAEWNRLQRFEAGQNRIPRSQVKQFELQCLAAVKCCMHLVSSSPGFKETADNVVRPVLPLLFTMLTGALEVPARCVNEDPRFPMAILAKEALAFLVHLFSPTVLLIAASKGLVLRAKESVRRDGKRKWLAKGEESEVTSETDEQRSAVTFLSQARLVELVLLLLRSNRLFSLPSEAQASGNKVALSAQLACHVFSALTTSLMSLKHEGVEKILLASNATAQASLSVRQRTAQFLCVVLAHSFFALQQYPPFASFPSFSTDALSKGAADELSCRLIQHCGSCVFESSVWKKKSIFRSDLSRFWMQRRLDDQVFGSDGAASEMPDADRDGKGKMKYTNVEGHLSNFQPVEACDSPKIVQVNRCYSVIKAPTPSDLCSTPPNYEGQRWFGSAINPQYHLLENPYWESPSWDSALAFMKSEGKREKDAEELGLLLGETGALARTTDSRDGRDLAPSGMAVVLLQLLQECHPSSSTALQRGTLLQCARLHVHQTGSAGWAEEEGLLVRLVKRLRYFGKEDTEPYETVRCQSFTALLSIICTKSLHPHLPPLAESIMRLCRVGVDDSSVVVQLEAARSLQTFLCVLSVDTAMTSLGGVLQTWLVPPGNLLASPGWLEVLLCVGRVLEQRLWAPSVTCVVTIGPIRQMVAVLQRLLELHPVWRVKEICAVVLRLFTWTVQESNRIINESLSEAQQAFMNRCVKELDLLPKIW